MDGSHEPVFISTFEWRGEGKNKKIVNGKFKKKLT